MKAVSGFERPSNGMRFQGEMLPSAAQNLSCVFFFCPCSRMNACTLANKEQKTTALKHLNDGKTGTSKKSG